MTCIGAPPRVLPSGEHEWLLESTPIDGFQGFSRALLYVLNHISYCFLFPPHVVAISMLKYLLMCSVDAYIGATICHSCSKART